jgi:hypothetical protein
VTHRLSAFRKHEAGEPGCWGFVTSLYVHAHPARIVALRTDASTPQRPLDALNRKGRRAMNGLPWTACPVEAVERLDRRIRRDDAIRRRPDKI